jgi:hypothetical protein
MTQFDEIECGGGGLCGWLSVDYWLETLPHLQMFDSKAELAREIGNGMLDAHIVLTLLREIAEKPRDYCMPNMFIIKENKAFVWVMSHAFDSCNSEAAMNSQRMYTPAAVAHLDVSQIRQWICNQVLNKTVWFNEVWCLALNYLSGLVCNNVGLVLLSKFNGNIVAQQYVQRGSNMFIMNCANTHWVAVKFRGS